MYSAAATNGVRPVRPVAIPGASGHLTPDLRRWPGGSQEGRLTVRYLAACGGRKRAPTLAAGEIG
jgi:hypothetical protein